MQVAESTESDNKNWVIRQHKVSYSRKSEVKQKCIPQLHQKHYFKENGDLFRDAAPVLLIIQFKWGVGGLVYSLIISTNQAINALAWGRLGYLTNPLASCHSVPFLLTEKQGTTTMAKKATKQIGITRDGREGDGGEVQMWFISPENTMKAANKESRVTEALFGSFTSSKVSWSTADRVKRHKSRTKVFKLQAQSKLDYKVR